MNRVLSKHSGSRFLPEKELLAKRLAQCLTSFLPSGVHLKALETYHIVFERIGPTHLAYDLPLYAGGLFPLFSYCATALKAPLLSLYENHFLPLGQNLIPVLDGFVLAVLPGVEEESSEFYIRSRNLLDKLGEAVGDISVFARSLWRALLLSPPSRLSAAHYLRLKLSVDQDEMRAKIVSDMPLVAYAITEALSDENALVQRSVLDLLLGELALNSSFFQPSVAEEYEAAVALVGGVFGALMRRDMSLTKRVHAWLLGGKEGKEGILFCKEYSMDLVLAAIDREFALLLDGLEGKSAKFATRPCRIAAALMDRTELSECLGHHFALRVLKYGRAAVARGGHKHDRDIRIAISDFLHDLGSATVFAELERMLGKDNEKVHEDFEVLTFALSMFPTTNNAVQNKHIPAVLRVAVQSLNAVSTDSLTLERAVTFCSAALKSMCPSRGRRIEKSVSADLTVAVSSFASFFVAWLAHDVDQAPVELRRAYEDVSIADEHAAELQMASICETRTEYYNIAKEACSFFVIAASFGVSDADTLRHSLQALSKCASAADVRISLAGSRAFAEVSGTALHFIPVSAGNDEQALGVIRRCWRQLHPSLRTATAQSAQAMLGLQRRFPEETKIVVADGILSTDLTRRLRNLERFACLWRLSVEHRLMPLPADDGLFLMLDALTDEDWAPKMLARSWLSDAVEVDSAAVLDAPLRLLLTTESRTTGQRHEFAAVYDAPRSLYGFQVIRGILESCSAIVGSSQEQEQALNLSSHLSTRKKKRGRTGIRSIATTQVSARTNQALAAAFALDRKAGSIESDSVRTKAISDVEGYVRLSQLLPSQNYVIAIALTCMGYLRGRVPAKFASPERSSATTAGSNGLSSRVEAFSASDTSNDELEWLMAGLGDKSLRELHVEVSAAAAECLATLLRAIPVPTLLSSMISSVLAEPVLSLVTYNISNVDPVLQLHFLNAIAFLVTADGPCYLSSVQGKDAFSKSDGGVRLSYSESQNQLPSVKPQDASRRGIQVGAAEKLKHFVPWLLEGVSLMYRTLSVEHDGGSHEILGVRRRWIHFLEMVMRHIGVTLPVVTEGLLCILDEFIGAQKSKVVIDSHQSDSEFSRVDEILVLLEGISVVTSNALWSFEYALANMELKDGIISNSFVTDRSRPSTGSSKNDTVTSADSGDTTATNVESEGTPSSFVSQNGHSEVSLSQGKSSNVGTVKVSFMMEAINPMRMIDFVKDKLSGQGSENVHRMLDPRRSGARILFCLLPRIMENLAAVWGPGSDTIMNQNAADSMFVHLREKGPPRLSTELPRERRQAQRASILSIVEPIFQLRPTDVIASVIALFSCSQSDFGTLSERESTSSIPAMACQVLHAVDNASVAVVISSVKTIFESAVKWDSSSLDAQGGKTQAAFRQKARQILRLFVDSGSSKISEEDIRDIGRLSPVETDSSIPGGLSGLELDDGLFRESGATTFGHRDLFYWGDYFAEYSPGKIETACLNFLEVFFATRRDREELQGAFSSLHAFLKDALSTARRKGTTLAILRVFGGFISRCPSPFPDRKARREIMSLAVTSIAACSSTASGNEEPPKDELNGRPKDLFKKELSVVALRTLAIAVPSLVDSSFLEDKPQLTNTVAASLSPAVSALKKNASRASAVHIAADNSRRNRGSVREASPRRRTENELEIMASKAATEVILSTSRRDWGVKFARRELLTLLEDQNFFFGKHDGVLEKTSAIVREVVAGGGASVLLSSIGSSSINGAPGIPSLFSGRDSETVIRGRAIRRIAYCIFVSEPDFYSPQLPSVLERLRDALRMVDAGLVVECLLCLRVLLLRIGPSAISAFRATTLSEIFRITSHPTDNLHATIAALRFLDLTTLLSPAEYSYERCFFFGENFAPKEESEMHLRPFQPLASTLTMLWTEEDRSVESVFRPPLRLKGGLTVLPGSPPNQFDQEFVGRYATALLLRNGMPKMWATAVDRDTVYREVEQEFLN